MVVYGLIINTCVYYVCSVLLKKGLGSQVLPDGTTQTGTAAHMDDSTAMTVFQWNIQGKKHTWLSEIPWIQVPSNGKML